nr:hypothetical protein [Tanacetum cinerariifolium]
MPRECLKIIESKSKVRQSRAKAVIPKLNLSKPNTYRSDLKRKEAYTAYSNLRGFIYQNKDKQNRLMRIDELHKFGDGTLNDVRTALDYRLKGIQMQYLPLTIWRRSDKDRAAVMIQAIDKQLKTWRIMQSLEKFIGGRLYEGDFRMLQRTNNQNNFNRGNNFNQNRGGNFNHSSFNQGQLHRPQSQGQSTQNKCQNVQNQYQNLQNQMAALMDMVSKLVSANAASSSGSGTLPGNTVTNPKEDLKGITTRSGVAYQGPKTPSPSKQETKVTNDQVQNPSSQNTALVQSSVIQPEPQALVSEPIIAPSVKRASILHQLDSVGSLRHHIVPIEELNGVLIVLVARSGVISKILAPSQSALFPTSHFSPFIIPKDFYTNLVDIPGLRDEAQAKNEDFLNKLDENIQKIIKEQVKAQVSKILPKIEKTVNDQIEAEVLTRSSNSSKTSHVKNLYKALVDTYECDKLILDTYGDTVTLKRRRDDEDKDDEPFAGSNRGSKRRRARIEPESTSALKEKTSKRTGKPAEGSKSHHKSGNEFVQA